MLNWLIFNQLKYILSISIISEKKGAKFVDAVDIDHDGDLDISISGVDSVSNFATRVHSLSGKVYKNEGSFNFTELLDIPGARILRFADLNGDSMVEVGKIERWCRKVDSYIESS